MTVSDMIAKEASGFVYCVSSLGVTGMRSEITTDIGAMVKLVKEVKDIPCAVGFGISTPDQAARMAGLSDGAIVGSAIVKLCKEYGADAPDQVKAYVKEMREAVLSEISGLWSAQCMNGNTICQIVPEYDGLSKLLFFI